MHLMAKGKGVADISKVSHNVGQVLKIFMLGLKSSGPVIKQRSKPEVLISKVVNKEQLVQNQVTYCCINLGICIIECILSVMERCGYSWINEEWWSLIRTSARVHASAVTGLANNKSIISRRHRKFSQ